MKKILLLSFVTSSIFAMQQPNRVEELKSQEKTFKCNDVTSECLPTTQRNENAYLSNAKRYAIAAGTLAYWLYPTVECFGSFIMPEHSPKRIIASTTIFLTAHAINSIATSVQKNDHE
jgi:hypothetical protein